MELREALPLSYITLDTIKEGDFSEGIKAFTRGKFVDSLHAFQAVLKKVPLVVVKSDSEASEVSSFFKSDCVLFSVLITFAQISDIVDLSREYVVGLLLETERQRLVSDEPENVSRNLDLAAYFTHCKLQPQHIQLALRSALRVFTKAGNHATSAVFARRLVDMKPSDSKVVSQVSRPFM